MSNGRLSGRVAVITGGTSGIGKAAVELFAAEGARVACMALAGDGEGLTGEPNDDRTWFLPTDVADPAAVEAALDAIVDRWEHLDILYGNAGVNENGDVLETTLESWSRVLTVDLSGQFHLVKFGVPHLLRRGRGVIILTASELALVGARRSVSYCAAKAGVVGLTRALATDLSPLGVRVNCLLPGPTLTPAMVGWIGGAGSGVPSEEADRERRQIGGTLLGRMATPQEIAKVALFLASDDSSYMTGALQTVDGGVTSWDHV